MFFEKKKVKIETLCEYLLEVRKSAKLSQKQVAEKTGIKLSFLQSLEEGKFFSLPPDVYVYGFLRQLAGTYGVDEKVLITQFKKEQLIQKQIKKQKQALASGWDQFTEKIVITPKRLSITVGVLFVVVTIFYIFWQVASINKTPDLEIFEPEDNQVITESFVIVSGQTNSGMSITVNNEDVFVEQDGSFKTQLGIVPGPLDLEIVAKNRFDKQASRKLSIIARQSEQEEGQLTLRLEFDSQVSLSYSIDGVEEETNIFNEGEVKIIEAQNQIVISTTDAGAVRVFVDNEPMGFLGKKGESLENIPFLRESDRIE